MAAVVADTDIQRLMPNSDVDDSEQKAASAGVVDSARTTNSCAAHGGLATSRRRWFVSVALLILLLMLSGGFCVWTLFRLSQIEARLKRLEIVDHTPVTSMVEPRHTADLFTPHRPVCTAVIFLRVLCIRPPS